jgi:hypothetical protein
LPFERQIGWPQQQAATFLAQAVRFQSGSELRERSCDAALDFRYAPA